MEGPYSARFPSSPDGETSRRASVIRGAAEERAHRPRRLRGDRARRVPSCTMPGPSDPDFAHRPVMADEIVDLFAPVPAGWVVDATLGGAGHATALLAAHAHLTVLGIDQDPDALAAASARLAPFGPRARTARARFDAMADVVATELPEGEPVVGVLFDLGVSSPQLDRAERGFSYRLDAPLDMRMDPSASRTADDVVNRYPEHELAERAAPLRRRALRQPHRPRRRRRPAGAHHRRAGRAGPRRHPRPRPPHAAATRPSARSRRSASRSTTSSTSCRSPSTPPSTCWPPAGASPCSRTTRARTAS